MPHHLVAICLAQGTHLTSALQADISTCSGGSGSSSSSPTAPKIIGNWTSLGCWTYVSFLFPSMPWDPLRCPLIHSCWIDPWNFRHYFRIVLDDLISSTTSTQEDTHQLNCLSFLRTELSSSQINFSYRSWTHTSSRDRRGCTLKEVDPHSSVMSFFLLRQLG